MIDVVPPGSLPAAGRVDLPASAVLLVSSTVGYRIEKIAQGMMKACHERGLSLLWTLLGGREVSLRRARPVGVVVNGAAGQVESLVRRLPRGTPFVSTVGSTLDRPIPNIGPDLPRMAELVVNHFADEGIRTFVFVGPRASPAARWNMRFMQLAVAKRLDGNDCHFFSAGLEEKFWSACYGTGSRFLQLFRALSPPVGIWALNDQVANSCIECLQAGGIAVPQEAAVVGIGNHPVLTDMSIALSSVAVDFEQIGREAVNLIVAERLGEAPERSKWERRYVGVELLIRSSSQLRLAAQPALDRALRYIQENFHRPIRLGDLARHAGMSRTSFSVEFRRSVGETPIQYVLRLRLAKARALLAETHYSISEVGFRVGFGGAAHFTRSFKRAERLTPTEYRHRSA